MDRPSSMRHRLTLGLLLVTAVLIILNFTIFTIIRHAIERDISERNLNLAHSIAGEVDNVLDQPAHSLRVVGERLNLDLSDNDIWQLLLAAKRFNPMYELIQVLDEKGRVTHVIPFSPDQLGLDMSQQPFFTSAVAAQNVTWSDAFISGQTGNPTVTIAVPFSKGIVAAQLGIPAIGEATHVLASNSTGFISVIDRRGVAVGHSEPKLAAQGMNFLHLESIRQGLSGKSATYREIHENNPGLLSVSQIKRNGWVVAVFQPEDAAFATIRQIQIMTIVVLAVGLPLLGALTYFFHSRLLDSIKSFAVQANTVAKGNFNVELKPEFEEFSVLSESFETMVERVKTREEELRKSQEFNSRILESSRDCIKVLDIDGRLHYMNHGGQRLLGIEDMQSILGMGYEDFWREPTKKLVQASLDLAKAGQSNSFIGSCPTATGIPKWWDVIVTPIKNLNGLIENILVVSRDITDRKRIEEERDRLFKLSIDMMCIASFDGYFTHINPAWEKTLGWPPETILSKPWMEFVHPKDRQSTIDVMSKLLAGEPVLGFENRYLCKDGSYRWLAWNSFPLPEEELLFAVCRDVTANKEAESELRASLREKEVLLQEIHHRVKNNLQVISSLLNLQAMHVTDPATKTFFRESRNRITSMALVHEQLYQSKNFAAIEFKEYIQNIALRLAASFSSSKHITLDVKADEAPVTVATAIPCGLIINELVTNAFKHAFKNQDDGVITISFSTNGESVSLAVADNGSGVPEDIDINSNKTLGMQLISALVSQLGGNLVIERIHGTRFIITVPTINT